MAAGEDIRELLGAATHAHQSGRMAEAEAFYRQILLRQCDHAHAMNLLGVVCHQTGRNREAVELLERAIALDPNSAAARCNLGMVLAKLCRYSEAIDILQSALVINPNFPEALNNLANAQRGVGQIDQAIDSLQRSLTQKSDPRTASNLLYILHFHPAYDPRRLLAAHVAWRKTYADPLKRLIQPHENTPDPDRRLRIGYVTPEMSTQPVAWFLLPLLESHDRSQFEIFCYSDTVCPDAVTEQIRAHTDGWRSTLDLSDQQMADLIRSDRIDILVDLALHTERNRLLVFAHKPAPIQVTYLAYCSTSGLDTIDYRFSDRYLDPPGADESVYSERTVHLESYWCYRAPPEAPAVGPAPCATNRLTTFGCLNNYVKVTRETLELWASVLRQVEQSRMVVHCAYGEAQTRTIDHMRSQGIDADRILFSPPLPLADYFRQYNQIDIALDTFPYAGGTTTCDALWMAVPVVTLSGKTAVSHGGASILSQVGLADLIAATPSRYASIAVALASDRSRLQQLRSTLRQRMLASPLMDAPRFARTVETAYRAMWKAWCESKAHAEPQSPL